MLTEIISLAEFKNAASSSYCFYCNVNTVTKTINGNVTYALFAAISIFTLLLYSVTIL